MAFKNFFDLKHVKTTPGGVIKAFRKNFLLTQQELSEITGLSHAFKKEGKLKNTTNKILSSL